jgi:hypothetical protein
MFTENKNQFHGLKSNQWEEDALKRRENLIVFDEFLAHRFHVNINSREGVYIRRRILYVRPN